MIVRRGRSGRRREAQGSGDAGMAGQGQAGQTSQGWFAPGREPNSRSGAVTTVTLAIQVAAQTRRISRDSRGPAVVAERDRNAGLLSSLSPDRIGRPAVSAVPAAWMHISPFLAPARDCVICRCCAPIPPQGRSWLRLASYRAGLQAVSGQDGLGHGCIRYGAGRSVGMTTARPAGRGLPDQPAGLWPMPVARGRLRYRAAP
jgi:hypothetical protein